MKDTTHILIGNNLLLKIDTIESANLLAIDKKGEDCIEVYVSKGTKWTIWNQLEKSRRLLRTIPKINEQFELLENIRACILKNRRGRESNVSKEIREMLEV